MSELLKHEAGRKPNYDDREVFDELRDFMRDIKQVREKDVGFLAEYVELVAAKSTNMVSPPGARLRLEEIDEFKRTITKAVNITFQKACVFVQDKQQ